MLPTPPSLLLLSPPGGSHLTEAPCSHSPLQAVTAVYTAIGISILACEWGSGEGGNETHRERNLFLVTFGSQGALRLCFPSRGAGVISPRLPHASDVDAVL